MADQDNSDLPRRDFFRLAGLGTGAILSSGLIPSALAGQGQDRPGRSRPSSHVIVIGAGVWGNWIAWNLRKQGTRVTVVEQYGPANSRATSGDETRGIRSSYGDRTVSAELWTSWARESIKRWRDFDAEHSKRFGTRFFFTTGDVILREKEESFTTRTAELWKKLGVKFESITADEAKKRWPQINSDGSGVVLYEPDAGVARARDSVQALAALVRDAGAEYKLGRVKPGTITSGQMDGITLDDGTKLTADAYVFACGPWLRKIFPELLTDRMRVPLGHAFYFGTPEGDSRFTHPNLPSWNVPGVTGWAALPVDSRGFRIRGGFAPPAAPAPTPAPGAAAAPPPPPPPQSAPDPRQQDPDLSLRWSTQDRIDSSRRVLAKHFPALAEMPLLETRACHYESSVNRNFIVDRLPGCSNAWVTGVGQAEGFKFAPVVGEYAAWRVLGAPGDPALAEAFRMPTEKYEANPAPNRRGNEEEEE
jgi:sarcosine oxidase